MVNSRPSTWYIVIVIIYLQSMIFDPNKKCYRFPFTLRKRFDEKFNLLTDVVIL